MSSGVTARPSPLCLGLEQSPAVGSPLSCEAAWSLFPSASKIRSGRWVLWGLSTPEPFTLTYLIPWVSYPGWPGARLTRGLKP